MQIVIKRISIISSEVEYLTYNGDWSTDKQDALLFDAQDDLSGAMLIANVSNKDDITHIYFIDYIRYSN